MDNPFCCWSGRRLLAGGYNPDSVLSATGSGAYASLYLYGSDGRQTTLVSSRWMWAQLTARETPVCVLFQGEVIIILIVIRMIGNTRHAEPIRVHSLTYYVVSNPFLSFYSSSSPAYYIICRHYDDDSWFFCFTSWFRDVNAEYSCNTL